jgi:hypothetical protein
MDAQPGVSESAESLIGYLSRELPHLPHAAAVERFLGIVAKCISPLLQ